MRLDIGLDENEDLIDDLAAAFAIFEHSMKTGQFAFPEPEHLRIAHCVDVWRKCGRNEWPGWWPHRELRIVTH